MQKINIEALECQQDQNAILYYQNGQPYTGVVYELLHDAVDIEYEVVNGMKQGTETEFYPNGKVACVSQYQNNLLEGPLTRYYETGEVQEKATFEQGVCIRSVSYDENGQVTEDYTIDDHSPEYPWLQYLRQQKQNQA